MSKKIDCSKELQAELEKAHGIDSNAFNKAIHDAFVDAIMKEQGIGISVATKLVKEMMKDRNKS